METDDIEDGEILEDESNSNEAPPTFPNNKEFPEYNNYEQKPRFEVNYFDNFVPHKEKRNHRHESHKRRDRSSFSDIPRKRSRRMDDEEGCIRGDKLYYEKNNKLNFEEPTTKNYDEEDSDDEMIFVLGGSLRDSERRAKSMKKHMMDASNDMVNPMVFNEGENEDPRPYIKRSPLRREKYKKDRNMSRGPERCQVGMAKRRGRGGGGGGIPRRGKPRDDHDIGPYSQGKGLRGNDCGGGYVHNYNQPRKLEICKFYLNDCCTKRDKCIYMHSDFPCKYYHTPGLTCHIGKNCKFSHSKLDEIQRAVLKKYADIPLKEIDDMQRHYRENSGNATYSAHKEKKEQASSIVIQNSRIPSLFDVKVSVPPNFRGIDGITKEDDEEGGSTPMPSPQSALQMYDEDENDETFDKKQKLNNVLSEHNDHESEGTDKKPSSEEEGHRSHHKKRSKKFDDYSDNERKHSEKRKKRSKKEDRKSDKDFKKNTHEQKEVQNSYSDLFPELEEPPWDLEENTEEPEAPAPAPAPTPPPAITEEQDSPQYDQREPTDALSHLPKKQQELFLRIQQHQKEAEASQNANADEKEDEDDMKQDVNWYSSDEEEEPEKCQSETTSPLATILRTIKTRSNNVPSDQKLDNDVNSLNTYLPSATSVSTTQETDPVVVDASQLANIDLSDEVTQLLTSIMKTDTSTTNQQISSYSLPITKEPQPIVNQTPIVTRRPSDDRTYNLDRFEPPKEDVDLRYINANNILNSASLFANNEEPNPNKDIDFRTLPFKPVPMHDAATEINASITAHPPMEYKLKPLPFIPRVNYAVLGEVAKICPGDPRFKRKLQPAHTENVDITPTLPPFVPQQDPRQALSLKTINEASQRADPRLADPRKLDRHDPRLDSKNIVPNSKPDQRADPRIVEGKVPDKEQVRPVADFRDPRLKSCKFPEVPQIPFPMITPIPPPIVPEMAQMPLRKEDPRLRFRANQK